MPFDVESQDRKLNEQGVLNRISNQIRNEKTLQFLFEQATKVTS